MAVVDDPAQQALLAEALLGETRPPEETEVASSLQQVQERTIESRLRRVRRIGLRTRNGGGTSDNCHSMKQKLELDRAYALRNSIGTRSPVRFSPASEAAITTP